MRVRASKASKEYPAQKHQKINTTTLLKTKQKNDLEDINLSKVKEISWEKAVKFLNNRRPFSKPELVT